MYLISNFMYLTSNFMYYSVRQEISLQHGDREIYYEKCCTYPACQRF